MQDADAVARPNADAESEIRLSSRVVVCIVTFRRAERLASLLRALKDQRVGEPFEIVVGNNDPTNEPTLAVLRDRALAPSLTIDIGERGVATVRNVAIAAILAASTAVEWIACIDDDQLPADDWLAKLVATGRRYSADLVGGPVEQIPEVVTRWSAAATDMSHLPKTEGPVPVLNAAGNLLLAAGFLRALDRSPFSRRFGRTGGEDYELFRHAQRIGARTVWAPGARVVEVIPIDRLTLHGLAWRAYSTAASQAGADRLYDPAGVLLSKTLVGIAKAPLKPLRSFMRERLHAKAIGLLVRSLAGIAGRVCGLMGLQPKRYGLPSRRWPMVRHR